MATSNTQLSKQQICKAAIATVMSKKTEIITSSKSSGDIVNLSYIRGSDGTKWDYQCKVNEPNIIWRTAGGRWRTGKYDAKVSYALHQKKIVITEAYSDGSKNTVNFSINEL